MPINPGMQAGFPEQPNLNQMTKTEELVDNRFNFTIYEIVMLVFFIFFVFNALIGKSRNEGYAQKWYSSNIKLFEENYAHVGVGTEYNTQSGTSIL